MTKLNNCVRPDTDYWRNTFPNNLSIFKQALREEIHK